ncbi:hypothetical protein KC363_g3922 [Hortaea werneckii]|nr:hypothetical protein KC361_g2136 [Hortaea werneckii]KAI6886728.1 hypothetical protein KC325_g2594 [Hortaea werneckii]KAI6996738.1 hypothetical protein KC359_g3326 [Hortaea werneckii]KAI7088761.1 hypothetical protein KC356_g3053 [Hortaea werneckii]KAI7148001.1 hypothetical protein KC344_g2313 [Hortaea werneckii]
MIEPDIEALWEGLACGWHSDRGLWPSRKNLGEGSLRNPEPSLSQDSVNAFDKKEELRNRIYRWHTGWNGHKGFVQMIDCTRTEHVGLTRLQRGLMQR